MNIDFVGVQRMDEASTYGSIVVTEVHRREISRVRERGHAPYRVTRGFRPAGHAVRDSRAASHEESSKIE